MEEPRVRDLLAQLPAIVGLMTGPDHRWSYVNQQLVHLAGRNSAADFLGKTFRESMPEVALEGCDRLLDTVYRTGEPYVGHEVKVSLNRAPAEPPQDLYFDLACRPARNAVGEVEGILVHAVEVTDKVNTRRGNEESIERLELAQVAAHIGTWEWDPIEKTQTLSLELHRIFGTDPSDPDRATTWASRVHRADWPAVERSMEEGYRAGIMDLEYRYEHPETGLRWLYCNGRRSQDESRMFGIVQDVTARRVAEEASQRLAAIVESSDDAIISKDLTGIITSWNPAARRIFGYSAEEIIGRSILRLIPEELHPEEETILEKIRTGQRIEHYETTRVRKDGRRVSVSVTISPIKDSSGRIVGASKIARDVSERKNKEEFRLRLAAIVDSSDDAIVSKDLTGIVTSWNPGAERMFGYTAGEIIGQPITTIIPPPLHPDEATILATIARGERIEHFETVRLKKNGDPIEVSLTVSPVRDEAGRIVGAAKIARDITQHKRTERALQTTERLASVGRLAATVAHEINNPLEAVINLIYLAKHASALAEVKKYLSIAEEELDRVSHLTKQTLGFYRETKGAAHVRLSELVTSLLSVFASRTRNRSIALCPEIKDDSKLYAVPGEIRQVVANLISNSVDALDAGGRVRIRVSAATQWTGEQRRGLRLTVADTGSGIPRTLRARLFEPFFTTKKDVGTGLGLWVCKNIIENHHGSIRVRSVATPGKSWTAFSVFLPFNEHESMAGEAVREAAV